MQYQRRKLTLGMFAAMGAVAAGSTTTSLKSRAQPAKPLPAAPPAGGRDDIVPLVRSFTGAIRKVQDIRPLTGMKLPGLENQTDLLPLVDTFVGDLDIRYAFDADSGFRYLNEGDLKALKVARDQVLRLAMANFHRRYPKIAVERPVPFVGRVINGGDLEPTMMLDAEFWEKEKLRPLYAGGELVAAAPARDVLWFTGLKSMDNVRNLQANTERSHRESGERAISKLMYLWRNRRWEVLAG
jgi:uncharacterized protein YtpQ (UPF0354 family)